MNPIGGIFSIKITKDFKEQKGQLNNIMPRAVVVAQLVEWFLLTPEFCSSNPVIGKLLY